MLNDGLIKEPLILVLLIMLQVILRTVIPQLAEVISH